MGPTWGPLVGLVLPSRGFLWVTTAFFSAAFCNPHSHPEETSGKRATFLEWQCAQGFPGIINPRKTLKTPLLDKEIAVPQT